MKDAPYILFNDKADVTFYKGVGADTVKVSKNNKVIGSVSNPGSAEETLIELNRYVQYNFIKKLVRKDPAFSIETRIVPMINGIPDTSQTVAMLNNNYELNEGNDYVLWMKNTSKKKISFNVVDFQNDDIINPFLPNSQEQIYPEDLTLKPGESKLFKDYVFTALPPYGKQILKVFVSSVPFNMEAILSGMFSKTYSKRYYENWTNFSSLRGTVIDLNYTVKLK